MMRRKPGEMRRPACRETVWGRAGRFDGHDRTSLLAVTALGQLDGVVAALWQSTAAVVLTPRRSGQWIAWKPTTRGYE
jgi:hypothetical protein